jgi:hypothetical protein
LQNITDSIVERSKRRWRHFRNVAADLLFAKEMSAAVSQSELVPRGIALAHVQGAVNDVNDGGVILELRK